MCTLTYIFAAQLKKHRRSTSKELLLLNEWARDGSSEQQNKAEKELNKFCHFHFASLEWWMIEHEVLQSILTVRTCRSRWSSLSCHICVWGRYSGGFMRFVVVSARWDMRMRVTHNFYSNWRFLIMLRRRSYGNVVPLVMRIAVLLTLLSPFRFIFCDVFFTVAAHAVHRQNIFCLCFIQSWYVYFFRRFSLSIHKTSAALNILDIESWKCRL